MKFQTTQINFAINILYSIYKIAIDSKASTLRPEFNTFALNNSGKLTHRLPNVCSSMSSRLLRRFFFLVSENPQTNKM